MAEGGVTKEYVIEEVDGLLGLAIDEERDGDGPIPVCNLTAFALHPTRSPAPGHSWHNLRWCALPKSPVLVHLLGMFSALWLHGIPHRILSHI